MTAAEEDALLATAGAVDTGLATVTAAAAADVSAAEAAADGAAADGAAAGRAAAAVKSVGGEAAARVAAAGARAAKAALSGAACTAAAELKALFLFSFHTSRLFLSFSLLFSLGRRFLACLRAEEEPVEGAAPACLTLQQKLNCSSPSQVSRVRRAHLLSCTHPLYSFKRVSNG
jgi:hypothetical protein